MNRVRGNSSYLDGALKDIIEALEHSKEYKFDVSYQTNNQYGARLENGSFSGMLGAVERNVVDMTGPITTSEPRAAVVDFTNCLEFSRLSIITGITSTDRDMFLYIKVFTWQVWILLMAAAMFVALISILIYDVSLNGWKHQQGRLFSRYMWIFMSFFTGHGCESSDDFALKNIWHRHSFRVLLAAWLLGPVVVTMYTFQGTITSTFAVSKLSPIVVDLEELGRKKFIVPVTSKGSALEICIQESKEPLHIQLWQRMKNTSIYFTPEEVNKTLDKIEARTHVILVDYIYALNLVSERMKRTGRCTIQVEPINFCSNFIALGIRKAVDRKTKAYINEQLNYIMQAKLADRWLNRAYSNYTHCTRQSSEGFKPLKLADVMGGFILWSIGIAASVGLLIIEIITYKKFTADVKLS